MKPDLDALAAAFTATLLAAGWNRYYGNRRFWASWCRPDGTRAGERGIREFLIPLYPHDAYHLSNHVMRKMAAIADADPAQRRRYDEA